MVHVCRADGVVIGKFEEEAFQEKMRRGELPVASGQYSYWHDGMTDWKRLSEYRPPGKITKLLWEFPTGELIRQGVKAAAAKSKDPRESAPEKAQERSAPKFRKRPLQELGSELLRLRKSTRELPDGYEFEFPADVTTYELVTGWAFQERSCCPSLDIDLRLEKEGGPLWLRLTGREGTKENIKAAGPGWVL